MDEDGALGVRELPPSGEEHGVGRRATREPTPDLRAVRGEDANGVAHPEVAPDTGDADGEDARALVLHRRARPRVEPEIASRAQGERDPVLLCREAPRGRDEEGALVFSGEDAREDVALRRVRDDDVRAGEGRAPGRLELARHSTRADVALRARAGPDVDESLRLDVADDGDARARSVEQSVDVGQQHEDVGVDERRHHRGQLVVVAELDLLDRDGVVLVQDRHRPGVQQRRERGTSVVRPGTIGEIGVGQEDLRDRDLLPIERLLVRAHQQALAGGGRRLETRHLLRSSAIAELSRPERDRSARDEDDAALFVAKPADGSGEVSVSVLVSRERARADLDDDPLCLAQGRARFAHASEHLVERRFETTDEPLRRAREGDDEAIDDLGGLVPEIIG